MEYPLIVKTVPLKLLLLTVNPLCVVRQVELFVSFATTDFNTQPKFLVVNDLPVAGILGSDFLSTHAAIISYADRCLVLEIIAPYPYSLHLNV